MTNAYAIEEARRNLQRKAPKAVAKLERLTRRMVQAESIVEVGTVRVARRDQPILGGAIASECSHLLTGDSRDFGHLFGQMIGGVKVVSPRMLADELVARGLLKKIDRG